MTLAIAMFLSTLSHAADFQISAALDRTAIPLNEQVLLSVTVIGSGTSLPAPQMPGLPDFQVSNAGRAQNFSWVNGQASASVTYNYILLPLKAGTFTIPPIRLEAGGQSAQSEPITLQVVEGDAAAIPSARGAPRAGNAAPRTKGPAAIFIKGTVDKHTVFVGEPITFTFQLYNRVPLFSRPNYKPPETTGLWSEDLPPQRSYNATVEGMPYNVTEVRTALFPTAPGTVKVGSAQLGVTIENLGSDPFSQNFFAQFFGRAEEKVLRTEPISLQVKPLPTPKPAGFNGAVGRYGVTTNLDKDATTVGQPVTLTVTISGEGNIKSLPSLDLPPLANFRTFDANAATNIEKKDGKVMGSKVYKTVLIPTTSGTLIIPSVAFVYFDPAARAYKTLQSRAFTLRVMTGTGAAASLGGGAPSNQSNNSAPQIQRLAEDIHYIKTPATLWAQGTPWGQRPIYWVIQGFFLMLVVCGGLWRVYQKVFLINSPRNRFKNAVPRALVALSGAEKALAQNQVKEAAGFISEGLHRYLADKLGHEAGTLALKQAQDALRDKGVHAHDVEKVRNLWEMLDLFEFAPTQTRPEEILQAIRTFRHVVEESEKETPWK